MTLPCRRFEDILIAPPGASPATLAAYLHERARSVVLNCFRDRLPAHLYVKGFPADCDEERALIGRDLPVVVMFEDTATLRPHRCRLLPPSKRKPTAAVAECVYCGARGRVSSFPDDVVPLFDANGVLHIAAAVVPEGAVPDVLYTFDAGHEVQWFEGVV